MPKVFGTKDDNESPQISAAWAHTNVDDIWGHITLKHSARKNFSKLSYAKPCNTASVL